MTTTYPAPSPTLTGDTLTISRFLASPTHIQRRLRTFRDLRFVSDQLLTQRFRSSGGAVLYDMSEPMTTNRPVEAVGAGSEYPYADADAVTAGLAAIAKWGQKTQLTDEAIARSTFPGSAVDRKLRKVVTSVIKQVDTITMSAIGSAITNTDATVGSWDNATPANRNPLEDLLLAVQAITDLNEGYVPNAVVVSPKAYTYLMLNEAIANLRRRETTDNPIYTGQIEQVANLTVIITPNLPVPTTAWVLDTTQLGGMADELDGAPGYAVSDLAVQVKSIRRDDLDAWDLQGRRKTVPVVQEPGAGFEITGVVS